MFEWIKNLFGGQKTESEQPSQSNVEESEVKDEEQKEETTSEEKNQ